MSRTRNRYKTKVEGSSLYHDYKRKGLNRKLRRAIGGYRLYTCCCNPDTPWKDGKPERDAQSDRNKGWKKVSGKKFRTYLKRDAAREIKKELGE